MRLLASFALLVFVGCGSNDPTDFNTARTESGGGGTAQGGSVGAGQGGASGTEPGGSGGAPLGGAGGIAQGGSGAGGTPSGGSAGVPQGGAAGTGVGGTNAGSGGMPPTGGGPTGGVGPGTGGSQTVTFSCGSLTCVADRQYCVRTLPPVSGQPEMRMCLPFPDSCTTVNCDCFCKAPMMSPCGPTGGRCTCNNNNGQISVQCGGG